MKKNTNTTDLIVKTWETGVDAYTVCHHHERIKLTKWNLMIRTYSPTSPSLFSGCCIQGMIQNQLVINLANLKFALWRSCVMNVICYL